MCKYFNCNEVDSNSPCYDCVSAHKRRMLEDKYEPMTNGDKIRKMNDEELAELMWGIVANSVDYANKWRFSENCLEYLQAESEE